jgi:hypothetical protein
MTVSQGNDSLSLDELKTLLKNDNKVKVAGIDGMRSHLSFGILINI